MNNSTLARCAALAIACVLTCMVPNGPAAAQPNAALATAAPQNGAAAAASQSAAVTIAETLLFQTDHLQNIHAPATLTYAFHKAGSVEPGFDDKVQLIFSKDKPAATMLFLSGPRQRQLADVDNPEGNPVLLAFLERDIAEMHRLTGGASNYFRKRIRLALAEAAQVVPRRFSYAGKNVDGREVIIEPYRNDPMHERFESYVGKRYSFIISAQVPGGIYQVHAAVPGAAKNPGGAGGQPLLDETLTLVSLEQSQR